RRKSAGGMDKAMLVTLSKKGNLTECKNYRTIALTSHMGKILMSILLNRLKVQTEEYIADEQAGFRRDRSTIQQILLLRLIAEKHPGIVRLCIIALLTSKRYSTQSSWILFGQR